MQSNAKLKIAVIIENDDKIYLQKERYLDSTNYKWNIVTGSYDLADGAVNNAALRECFEEAGIKVKLKGVYKVVTVQKEGDLKIYFVFIAEPENDIFNLPSLAQQKEFGEDITEQKWIRKEDVLKMNPDEFVTNTIGKIILQYANGEDMTHSLNSIDYIEMEKTN